MDSMQVGCKVGMSGCEGFGHTNGCGALVRCSLCCFSYDLSTGVAVHGVVALPHSRVWLHHRSCSCVAP